ncbi:MULTISPECIES: hypothetical protein [Streptosporangium]|uniref:Prepilin signal peptidase PulO-like enzyme (Type II secretory pathway) n=1 Tax=Streptosporangium brasiliense TaxID=47480 RepID=A0ABT9RIB7_9ACTN|nr:hypothetical protein [Streptosporangium brasiliense]MDP9869037.1 prepilin signal peptidase PulO-like enzyme (type II secretory pathway) [Streptosporangium brasiliense]
MKVPLVTLFRERPASRLLAAEALCALPIATLTLPASTPDHHTVPDWVQSLGLMMLFVLYGTVLSTWRLVMVGGLHPAPTTRQQIRDDRRLRMLVLSYPPLVAMLLPIPSTWTLFWFGLTLATAVGGATSLVRMVVLLNGRSIRATAADHTDTPTQTATEGR